MDGFYHNQGGGRFGDVTAAAGVAGGGWSTSAAFLDHDLDGDFDLYVANGHVLDNIATFRPGMTFAESDQLIENELIEVESSANGARRRFVDVSSRAGEWFSRATVSRSAASCDYDNDGDEDIAVLSSGSRAVLLRNDGPHGHWIAFQLQGTRSNRDGYGAKVAVHARQGGDTFTRDFESKSARSYASACDPRVRAGLGQGPVTVERVEIRWPSGAKQAIEAPAIDRVHRVVEPAGEGGGVTK